MAESFQTPIGSGGKHIKKVCVCVCFFVKVLLKSEEAESSEGFEEARPRVKTKDDTSTLEELRLLTYSEI